MNKEIISMLKIISASDDLISIRDIAAEMEISSGKVKGLIKKANDLLPREVGKIIGKAGNGQGYRLMINNKDAFERFLIDLSSESSLGDREVRILNLLDILLSGKNVRIDDLAEQLYVSRTQLTKDLKDVRELLRPYDLQVISTPYKGLSVQGSEFNKRLCLSSYLQRDVHFDWEQVSFINESIPADMKQKIEKILYSELKEENYHFSDAAFQSLVTHLAIMLLRVKKGLNISNTRIDLAELDLNGDLFYLAKRILDHIARDFSVTFSSGEEIYFSIHLAGKRYWENDENIIISERVSSLTNRMLQLIKEEYHLDLFDCFDLRIQLDLHLTPLLTRIRYHLNMVNPLLNEIKSRFVYEFDMALDCCRIIEEEYKCRLSEDEISYIALYLGLQLDKNRSVRRKNILLVCPSGKVSSMIVKDQLQERFPDYLDRMDPCLVRELEGKDLSGYDYIFTTVPFRTRVSIPIINIRYFLTEDEFKTIGDVLKRNDADVRRYFREELFVTGLQAENKEEIIRKLVEKAGEQIDLPAGFLELVKEREEISPTDFSYRIAMPHPIRPVDSDTFVCVGILPRAVHWANRKVQIIFLVSVKRKTSAKLQDLYKLITGFVSDKQKVDALIREPTYACFLELLNS